MWVRGLKHVNLFLTWGEVESHPVWVRGLKLVVQAHTHDAVGVVAPRVGAWIETLPPDHWNQVVQSHPVWVRGLKPIFNSGIRYILIVAPRVGAWIETHSIRLKREK